MGEDPEVAAIVDRLAIWEVAASLMGYLGAGKGVGWLQVQNEILYLNSRYLWSSRTTIDFSPG